MSEKFVWKARLYIGTSIFDGLLSNVPEASEAAITLFEKCKYRTEYEGLISPFTIFELRKRYNDKQFQKVIDWAVKYDLNLVAFHSFREVDHLVGIYFNKKILPKELEFDYFHIASCTYLNIDFYVCWNIEDLINYRTFNKFFHSHLGTGYQSAIKLRTPEFLIGKTYSVFPFQIIQNTYPSKIALQKEVENHTSRTRTEYVQTATDKLILDSIPRIGLPNKRFYPSRQPLLKIDNVEFNFQVKSYEKEIEKKEIPLLGDIRVDMYHNYHLFQLTTLEGSELLKNKQVEIYSHFPVDLSSEEHAKYSIKKNTHFINWLLPQLRTFIEKPIATFPELEENFVKRNSFKEIDEQIHRSVGYDYNDVKLAKEKAIELTEYITKGQWARYNSFSIFNPWSDLNGYGEYDSIFCNHTHLIIEKEGKEIWILMVISHIP